MPGAGAPLRLSQPVTCSTNRPSRAHCALRPYEVRPLRRGLARYPSLAVERSRSLGAGTHGRCWARPPCLDPIFVEASLVRHAAPSRGFPPGEPQSSWTPAGGVGPVAGPARLHSAFEGTSSTRALGWSAASAHNLCRTHTLPRRINDWPLGNSPACRGETRRLVALSARAVTVRHTCSIPAWAHGDPRPTD